jgi:hypothetical protein
MATKRPVKGLERGPYGPKINGNLINVIYKDFVTILEVSKKIGPGAENRVL